MNSFSTLGLQDNILSAIHQYGFTEPTPIQAKTIPHLLESRQDIIALAQTGTGKTAAFGLPAIQLTDIASKNPQTLVLCPTRELCMQITRELSLYAKNVHGIGIVAVYGGASIDNQIRELGKHAQIVVGTPGRVKDLISRKKLKLDRIERLVLDEADEMLSMGFKEDLDAILSKTPSEKQVLLFSATMSNDILKITKKYMHNTLQVSVSTLNIGAENVNHLYYMAHAKDRYEVLKRIADMQPDIYGIIFCRTRRETKDIAHKLIHDGYNADAIHGELSQTQRDEVMNRFRKRQLQLLVATDVAARGLDVEDLTHIINYNIPDAHETYVHRSGRTGRAGKKGTSIAIIHTREARKIKDISRRFGISFTREMVPSGRDICQRQLLALIDKIENVEVDENQIAPFLPAVYEQLEWLNREELIKHFVSAEFNRFLDYYKHSRNINISEDARTGDRKSRTKSRQRSSSTDYTRLFINVGKLDNLNPLRLMGMINHSLPSGKVNIGKIDIMKKFSFFDVESKMADTVIKTLNNTKFDETTLVVQLSQERPVKGRSSKRKGSDLRYSGKSGKSRPRKRR